MDTIALPPGLPAGFGFRPTDEELITHYLKPKLLGTDPAVDRVIAEVDFYNFEPWELPDKSKIQSNDRMWFFFCRIDYKYRNSKRVNRKTKTGSWKITGKELVIKDNGKKRTLVFQRGSGASGRGERADWVMHEYFVESDQTFSNQSPYVLCRLRQVNDLANAPDCNGGEPRGDDITEVESSVIPDANSSANGVPQTTNPELGAKEFDDSFAPPSNEEVFQMLESEPSTNPELGAKEFDDWFVPPSNEEGIQTLQSQPLYSPGHYYVPCCALSSPPPPPPVGFFRRMITSLKSASIPFLTRGRCRRRSQL